VEESSAPGRERRELVARVVCPPLLMGPPLYRRGRGAPLPLHQGSPKADKGMDRAVARVGGARLTGPHQTLTLGPHQPLSNKGAPRA
jgi:hypothetical protein